MSALPESRGREILLCFVCCVMQGRSSSLIQLSLASGMDVWHDMMQQQANSRTKHLFALALTVHRPEEGRREYFRVFANDVTPGSYNALLVCR
jgi:hypothetical protein